MAEIVFTAEAIRDIEEIRAYIAQDSARYADRQVQRFYQEVERLARFPLSGRVVPEIEVYSVREIIIGNYRMMYRLLEGDIVEIMIIHHGKRRFPYGKIMLGEIKPPRRRR